MSGIALLFDAMLSSTLERIAHFLYVSVESDFHGRVTFSVGKRSDVELFPPSGRGRLHFPGIYGHPGGFMVIDETLYELLMNWPLIRISIRFRTETHTV